MTAPASPPRRRATERELLRAVAGELEQRGYRTYLDPDGSDYFDLAARRDGEVGLVEGKVGAPSALLTQAVVRRPWADWVGVVVPSARTAERLVARTAGRRAAFVGVWSVEGERPREHRPAAPTHPPGDTDPFARTRERLRRTLAALDGGELPGAVRWSGVVAEVRRASAGRRWREWRLDERPSAAD